MMDSAQHRKKPAETPHSHAADHRKNLRVSASAEALDRASRLFRALGDVPRMRLLTLLADGPACVTELADAEHENISTVSQRLRVLRAENLVSRQREGKHIRYTLADAHVFELITNALAHASEAPAAIRTAPKTSTRKEIVP
jgi:ArsR family transcriptional regulator